MEVRAESRQFAVGHGVVLRHLFMLHGRWWTVGLLTAFAVGVVASLATTDVRWFICGLMVLLIVAPMVMGLLYVNYALDADCAFNVLPHTLSLHPEGVMIRIWTRTAADPTNGGEESAGDDNDEWGSEKRRKRKRKRKKSLWNDVEESSAECNPEISAIEERMPDADFEEKIVERVVPYAALQPVRIGMGAVVVLWRDNGRGIMLVPPEAFPAKAEFEKFVVQLSASLSDGRGGEPS